MKEAEYYAELDAHEARNRLGESIEWELIQQSPEQIRELILDALTADEHMPATAEHEALMWLVAGMVRDSVKGWEVKTPVGWLTAVDALWNRIVDDEIEAELARIEEDRKLDGPPAYTEFVDFEP